MVVVNFVGQWSLAGAALRKKKEERSPVSSKRRQGQFLQLRQLQLGLKTQAGACHRARKQQTRVVVIGKLLGGSCLLTTLFMADRAISTPSLSRFCKET
jgi:hypothetical protein